MSNQKQCWILLKILTKQNESCASIIHSNKTQNKFYYRVILYEPQTEYFTLSGILKQKLLKRLICCTNTRKKTIFEFILYIFSSNLNEYMVI